MPGDQPTIQAGIDAQQNEGGLVLVTNGVYDAGTVVALTASADAGFQFDGWSGSGLTGSSVTASSVTDKTGYSISGTKNTLDDLSGADGDTLETLSDQIDAISTGGVNVISALDGTIQAKYAADGGTVEVVRGDTVSIPYDLTVDMTGKKLYFAVKKKAGDSVFAIDTKEITSSITDAAEGQGVIPLLTAELDIAPASYDAEVEMRNNDGSSNPLTVLKFQLKVVEQVI